jgi:hypothetical protein
MSNPNSGLQRRLGQRRARRICGDGGCRRAGGERPGGSRREGRPAGSPCAADRRWPGRSRPGRRGRRGAARYQPDGAGAPGTDGARRASARRSGSERRCAGTAPVSALPSSGRNSLLSMLHARDTASPPRRPTDAPGRTVTAGVCVGVTGPPPPAVSPFPASARCPARRRPCDRQRPCRQRCRRRPRPPSAAPALYACGELPFSVARRLGRHGPKATTRRFSTARILPLRGRAGSVPQVRVGTRRCAPCRASPRR